MGCIRLGLNFLRLQRLAHAFFDVLVIRHSLSMALSYQSADAPGRDVDEDGSVLTRDPYARTATMGRTLQELGPLK